MTGERLTVLLLLVPFVLAGALYLVFRRLAFFTEEGRRRICVSLLPLSVYTWAVWILPLIHPAVTSTPTMVSAYFSVIQFVLVFGGALIGLFWYLPRVILAMLRRRPWQLFACCAMLLLAPLMLTLFVKSSSVPLDRIYDRADEFAPSLMNRRK